MLFQIGPLTLDTAPMEVGSVSAKMTADFVKHDLVGARRDYEFTGPGDESLTLSGRLLPFHIGGLAELEIAKQLCASGQPQFVMRGDGRVMGWFQVMSVGDDHETIAPTGLGFVVTYTIELERVDDPGADTGAGAIIGLLSLFG